MTKRKLAYFTAITLLFPLALPSCGGDGSTDPKVDPPEVSSVTPAVSGGTVGLLQDFVLTFSAPMNPATLSTSTVTVSPMAGQLHLSYDADTRQLWVAPDSMFPADANLTLAVSSGARDTQGNALDPYSLSFSTGPATCVNMMDRFEPNEAPPQATPVELDSLVAGLSVCDEDQDYYRFAVDQTAKVTAHTYITEADDLGWGIHFVRLDGEEYATLGTSVDTGDDEDFRFTFHPGEYFLRVFSYDDGPLGLYDLFLETSTPCVDDAFEDNDFRDEAVELAQGTYPDLVGCYLDADWFNVPILTGQTLTVTFDLGPEFDGIRRLVVQEPGLDMFVESGIGGAVTGTVTATADGFVTVMAMVWQDDIPYDLVLEISGP